MRTLVLCVLLALAGCGGNGDDDERATVEPVNCQSNPEKCR